MKSRLRAVVAEAEASRQEEAAFQASSLFVPFLLLWPSWPAAALIVL